MYLVQTLTDLPHDKIGKHFGKADHSSSIYGCKKTKKMLSEGHSISRDIEQIKARLLVASASNITKHGADHDGKQLGRTA